MVSEKTKGENVFGQGTVDRGGGGLVHLLCNTGEEDGKGRLRR